MMRVLHVVATAQRRGAEVFAADLIAAHAAEGAVPVEQRVAVLRATDGAVVRFAAPVEQLGANGSRGPLSIAAVRSLRGSIKSWRPDVVVAHGGEALKYAVAARALLGPPVVYRRIGSAHGYADRRAARALYARLMRRARVTVAVADAVKRDTVQTFGVPARRVVTIPNGVDRSRLQPSTPREQLRATLGVGARARVILSAGALTWEKDPVGLVEVCASVMRDRADVVLLMAGDGPLLEQVEAAIERHGLAERVRLLGNRDDVPDLMAAADVVLLASATEGMPGVLIEAGIAGRPVVSYDIGGVAEIVEHGVTGLLAPAADRAALAGALAAMLDDDALRRRMGEAARTRCSSSFDITAIASRYRALYEDVIAR